LVYLFESESGSAALGKAVTGRSLRPDAAQIRSRIMTIIFKEKMQIPANVVDELITGVGSDVRQVLNMLSTWKLHNDTMDYDEGKILYARLPAIILGSPHMYCSAKASEKYTVMTPFNVVQKILGPYMFSASSHHTLNDKIELYFHDYSFVPLFIQVGAPMTRYTLAKLYYRRIT
jgi:replication factor C subunit 1